MHRSCEDSWQNIFMDLDVDTEQLVFILGEFMGPKKPKNCPNADKAGRGGNIGREKTSMEPFLTT